MLALEGVNMLDLSRYGPGPYCTMILGDLGAEIIKIAAPPVAGARWPMTEGRGHREAAYQEATERNKKSILLNLKTEESLHIFYQLVKETDVIVEGFRPGVAKRLGIDYPTMSEINPKIIYCSISGFGQDGPYRDLPGHDINYISFGGVLNLLGEANQQPAIPLNFIADYGAAAKDAAIGILSALIARNCTDKGQYIDISMTDSTISLLTDKMLSPYFQDGILPKRGEHFLGGGSPDYSVYQTKDGKYLTIGCLEPHLWANLCRAIGKDDFIPLIVTRGNSPTCPTEDKKLAEIFAYLNQLFLTKTRDEWFEFLSQKDIAIAKVYSLDELIADPQVLHREMVIEMEHPTEGKIKQVGIAIKMSDTPGKIRNLSPLPGEHTDEILFDLGYDQQRISQLRQEGAIG